MKDYFGYGNKVCVVTGSASGMGKALAQFLVDAGAIVYALDRNPTDVAGLEKGIICDLIYKDQIDKVFHEDIPYEIDNYFGIAGISGLHNTMLETFKVNFLANKYIIEEYIENRMCIGGSITLCTSSAGLKWETEMYKKEYQDYVEAEGYDETLRIMTERISPLEGKCVTPLFYAGSKKAVNYWMSTKVVPLAKKGIRINAVLPMATDTGLRDDFAAFAGGTVEDMIRMGGGNAGRMALSREQAEPLAFLGSHMASYISGHMLVVDFGLCVPEIAGLEKPAHPDLPSFITMEQIRGHSPVPEI